MHRQAVSLVTLTALLDYASAACQLSNSLTSSETPVETRTQLCMSQGAGSWTFAMENSLVDVPTLDSGAEWGGLTGSNAYIIYDNACVPRGVYGPSGDDCGVPYYIEENFLPYVLTIEQVDTGISDGYFKFAYANGLFTIGNNGCTCEDMSSGLAAEQGCKCAFPLEGESD